MARDCYSRACCYSYYFNAAARRSTFRSDAIVRGRSVRRSVARGRRALRRGLALRSVPRLVGDGADASSGVKNHGPVAAALFGTVAPPPRVDVLLSETRE